MVAGDEAGIDSADRSANNPVRSQPSLMQCFIHPGLVGAQSTAPFEDESDMLGSAPGDRVFGGSGHLRGRAN